VPSLIGDSLAAAKKALTRSRCRIGKVTEPRHGRGKLHVASQSRRKGKRLPSGTRVAVTLGTQGPSPRSAVA
jgi:beta-lactam-binding protein with PASTA domain